MISSRFFTIYATSVDGPQFAQLFFITLDFRFSLLEILGTVLARLA